MISAFGVEHGQISKARLPGLPQVVRTTSPASGVLGTTHTTTRAGTKLFKPKKVVSGRAADREGNLATFRNVTGGGMTGTGRAVAGGVGAAGAAGGGAAYLSNRRNR